MFIKTPFTKETLDACLKELGKEFRKLNGTAMRAEVVLVGGAAILANYGFRNMMYGIDALIMASSAMEDVVNRVGDRLGLPNDWLNTDFKQTASYSDRLADVSVHYQTFSNVLTVQTVAAEYLIAMKVMSGRQYRNDLSDIAGILWEHEKRGEPITKKSVNRAVIFLYGSQPALPPQSKSFINAAFTTGDYERIYNEIQESEQQAKDILLEINRGLPTSLNEDSIDAVLERARRKRDNAAEQ